ncbi:MAG: peptide chain release factor 2 [Spirochaetes bacterium]|nr:peptide chain release factor 2 [Spirochaetota bacterium]
MRGNLSGLLICYIELCNNSIVFKRDKKLAERDYRDILKELNNVYEKANLLYQSLNIKDLKAQQKELEQETYKDDFWKNQENVTEVNLKISRIKKRIDPWEKLISEISDEKEIFEMAAAESDELVLKEISAKIEQYNKRFDDLETLELFSDESDVNNAFIIIHPGAGGTESQDWALMLYRMYLRWADDNNFAIDPIDYTPGEEAGIKSSTTLIKGDYAYGLLKSERGIHRLVRISPFDANKRRHTSFASVEIIPEVSDDIDIEINESELRIDTYRSSGAGGQHVNTTDSAVRITHIPTGIVVQCQNERSQHKNKAFAMKVLKAKLYDFRRKERDAEKQEMLGQKKEISWGNQIRSYVFHPYTLVKDHRTEEETGNSAGVLDGDINRFIYAYLRSMRNSNSSKG